MVLAALGAGLLAVRAGDPLAGDPNTIPLSMKTRVYLANIEERGLTLSNKGFPAVKAAIKSDDPAKLRAFLADDFRARVLDVDDGPVTVQPF